MRPTLLLASTALLFAACIPPTLGDDVVEEPGTEPGTDAEPLPALRTDGAYTLETTLDVQAAAVLPQTAYDAVEAIRGLRDEPGRTLFDLAEQAGVPAVGELRAALPGALESRLYGWIDDELATYTQGDGPVAAAIDGVLTVCETSLAEVQLSSELTLDGATATHRLREIGFAIDGLDLRYDLDLASLDGLPLALDATVDATVVTDGPVAQLTLGRHAFGLPFGQLAMTAIEDVMQLRYGTDLRGVLGQLVDCPALAADIADRCYLSVCVGHESQLRSICEGGLDRLAGELRGQVIALDFDAITMHVGTAKLTDDASADVVADTVVGGVWTADLDAGMGPRHAPGSFTGGR